MTGASSTQLSGPNCGATLIGPNVAVTAAHCVVLSGESAFGMGFGAKDSGPAYVAKEVYAHPSYDGNGAERYRHDLALLVLQDTPPVAPATIAGVSAGDVVRYIGYGRVTPGTYWVTEGYSSERKSTDENVTKTDALSIWTTGVGGGLCWGDSGGPIMRGNEALGVLADFDGVFDCQIGNRMIFTSLQGEAAFIQEALACALGQTCTLTPYKASQGCYACNDYGYSEGQCLEGWACHGGCLVAQDCSAVDAGTTNGSTDGGTTIGTSDGGTIGTMDGGTTIGTSDGGSDGGSPCTYLCSDYGYIEGQCTQDWACENACMVQRSCGGSSGCEFLCSTYGYSSGECRAGWYCDGQCLVAQTCGATTSCTYSCSDYGYGPGECYSGWSCDGQCLTYKGTCS